MLIRESQFRLTMLQNIKDLVMDAEDNKKTNQALMRNISDVTAIMQTITEKDRLIEKENDQLRLDLNILKDAINHEDKNPRKSIHNLDLTTIPILLTEWEADYLEFNYKLKTMIEADRKIQETRNKLNDEIVTVRSKRNMTTETLERLMEMGLSLARKQTSTIQNANHELSSDNIEIKKQLAMLNDTLQNAVNKGDVDVFRIHYNERFQMFDATLMNLSLSINETVEKGLAERRNGHDEQTKGFKGSCMDILKGDPQTKGKNGVYQIRVNSEVKSVYCDMSVKGGGWTAIQRRQDGSTNFNRTWKEYKQGFGDPSTNYWIGNDAIHALAEEKQTLRVHLRGFDGRSAYADYSSFFYGNEAEKYHLLVSGYSGIAGDYLTEFNAAKFSTRDQNNVGYDCVKKFREGWWFRGCYDSTVNGEYADSALDDSRYMGWFPWKLHVALKGSLMMIRPKS
ncbi:angiopoietin-1-like [Ostrea edulis]|uniref:angiopoietin-1-like n=1 Tax=Ostrea edulis TaxID=37623 RepID=UPI0024AFE389|nr:angiopoietin-1-like [Ostrea edulis]